MFSDDFSGSADDLLSARSGWTKHTGSDVLKINASNQLKGVSGGDSAFYYCTDLGASNAYAQCVVAGVGKIVGLTLTFETGAGHCVGVFWGTATNYKVFKNYFTLIQDTGVAPSASDVVAIEYNSGAVRVLRNGSEIYSGTPSLDTVGTKAGLVAYYADNTDPVIDNFVADTGTIPAGGGIPGYPLLQRTRGLVPGVSFP